MISPKLHTNGKASASSGSPYADASRVHIEREAPAIKAAAASVLRERILLATLVLALAAIVVLATQPKRIPVYVDTSTPGLAQVIGSSPGRPAPNTSAIRGALGRWISDARSVSSDPLATKERQRNVAALVARGSQAAAFLGTWNAANDPAQLAYTKRVAVSVAYVAAIGGSDREYEAEWVEDARDPSGAPLGPPARYHAHFSTTLSPGSDDASILANPLGLYITDLSWSAKAN